MWKWKYRLYWFGILWYHRLPLEWAKIHVDKLHFSIILCQFKTFRLVGKTYIFQRCATFVQIDNANHRCLLLWLRFLWFYLSNALFVRAPPSFLNWSKWVISIVLCQFELFHLVRKTYIFETVYNFLKLIIRNVGVITKISLIVLIKCTVFESPSFFKLVKMSDFNCFLSIWINPSCQELIFLKRCTIFLNW